MISTINLKESALLERSPTVDEPFCNKKFQFIRVIGSDYYHSVANLFYNAVSAASYLFDHRISTYYEDKARYHLIVGQKLYSWLHNKHPIIAFANNLPDRVFERTPAGMKPSEWVKRSHQLKDLDWQPFYGEVIIPEKINPIRLWNGCCAGMSGHFILSYLTEIQAGKSPEEAVHRIAPLYEAGAPRTAQITQMFQQALDANLAFGPLSAKFKRDIDQIADSEISNLSAWQSICKIFRSLGAYLGLCKPLPKEKTFKEKLDDRLREFNASCEIITENFPSTLMLGIFVDQSCDFSDDKLGKEEAEEGVQKLLDTLQDGIYQLSLNGEEGGHATVFVKTKSGNYLFDSNYATYSVSHRESGKEIARLMQEYYPKGCKIIFRHCHLSDAKVLNK